MTNSCLFKDLGWRTYFVNSPSELKWFREIDALTNYEAVDCVTRLRIRGNYIRAYSWQSYVESNGSINGEPVEFGYTTGTTREVALFYVRDTNRYLVATKASTKHGSW